MGRVEKGNANVIDSRLVQNEYLAKREQEKVQLGKAATSQTWASALQTALSTQMQALLLFLASKPWRDECISDFCEKNPLPTTSAGVQLPDEIRDQIAASLINPQEEKYPGADWFIGSAIFDAAAVRNSGSDGLNIARVISPNATRILAFADAFGGASPDQRKSVLDALNSLVSAERNPACIHVLGRNSQNMTEALEQWEVVDDITEVWSSRIWRGLDIIQERVGILMPLADVAPSAVLPLLEDLQVLPLIESTLYWRSISSDLDKVLALLDVAPTSFDHSGKWNKKVVAALLLKIAFECLTQLAGLRDDRGGPVVPEGELEELAKKIVERTLNRTDGIRLLTAWVRYQIFLAKNSASSHGFMAILQVMVTELAKSSVLLRDVYPDISTPQKVEVQLPVQFEHNKANDAFDRLTLAAMLERERVLINSAKRCGALRSSFLSLMRVARHPFAPLYGEPVPSWRHYAFADLYLGEADPVKAWRADFDSFSVERRTHMHWSYTDDDHLMAPSLFLCSVGLALTDMCREPDCDPTLHAFALPMWNEIFEATRQHFTHGWISADSWRQAATALFARYPACSASQESEDCNSPQKWLKLLGGDELLYGIAVAYLVANNMPLATIAPEHSQRTELEKRIRSYIEWEGSAGSRTLAAGVVRYLQENVLAASNRQSPN